MKGTKSLLVIASIAIIGVGIDVAVLRYRNSPKGGALGSQFEASPQPETPPLTVHGPGGEVSLDDVRFAWSPLDTLASYKLVMLDDHWRQKIPHQNLANGETRSLLSSA